MNDALPTQPRTLVLMRHATAEADAVTDAERPLTARGLADAAEAGGWLAGRGVSPQRALVSAAARTRATWQALSDSADLASCELVIDEGLYAAGPETALDLIRRTDDAVGTILVLGHNPTIGYLAQLLDGGDGDPGAATEMARGFPPGAVAVLTTDRSWADLGAGEAMVAGFHVGRA